MYTRNRTAATDAAARTSTRIFTAAAAATAATAAAAGAAAGTAALALAFAAVTPAASASTVAQYPRPGVQVSCVAVPSKCGYPDATRSGVPAGTRLLSVPGQISSGRGWKYIAASQYVEVSGNGAVLSGLSIPYNLDITASNVTIKNSRIATSGSFAVSLRHTANVTIENSTIGGADATTGRAGVAITDVYGDSAGMVIKDDNISDFKTAVQISAGTITGNYIHNPGYVPGDHTNGIFDTGTTQPLTITGNTILNSFGQTDAISLDASQPGQAIANKTIENNLLAGGSYTIYGGNSLNNTSTRMLIENNRFGQQYYPRSGQYGPVAYFTTSATNIWIGNIWDTTGATIPAP
jgi:Right handed beta helix region